MEIKFHNKKAAAAGLVFVAAILIFIVAGTDKSENSTVSRETGSNTVDLPAPELTGDMSLEEVLRRRTAVRNFSSEPLTLKELSQLLWAGGGFREVDALSQASRTYPSAGGIYPLHVYVSAQNVKGLEEGIYRYIPEGHALKLLKEGDFSGELQSNALGQSAVGQAAVNLIYTADYDMIEPRYGRRGTERYIYIDIGHAAENLALQAVALSLGAAPIGAFNDTGIADILGGDNLEGEPVCIIPVGRP